MVAVQSTERFSTRFSIEVEGRRFPAQSEETVRSLNAAQMAAETVELAEPIAKLREQLAVAVSAAVSSLKTISMAANTKQAILEYQAALKQLSDVQQSWQELMQQIAVIEFEHEQQFNSKIVQDDADAELGKWRAEIFANPALSPLMFPPALTAELTTRRWEDFTDALAKNIELHIVKFVDRMLEQLFALVDLQVVGFVEWYGPKACTYHRFQRLLRTDFLSSSTQARIETTGKRPYRIHEAVEKGTHIRRLCRNVQHVVEAELLMPWKATIVIPKRQEKLIADTPRWLLPEVRLIEGDLIREMVVTQDLAVREWKYTRELRRDLIYYHRDPALVLGPFVLAAWGPTEIQAELQERSDQKLQEENFFQLKVGAIALGLAALLCVFSGWIPLLSLASLVLCIGASFALGTLLVKEDRPQNLAKSYVPKPNELKLQVYAVATVGTTAMTAFGLGTGSIGQVIFSGLIAAVFGVLYIRHLVQFCLPAAKRSRRAARSA